MPAITPREGRRGFVRFATVCLGCVDLLAETLTNVVAILPLAGVHAGEFRASSSLPSVMCSPKPCGVR